MQFLLSHWHCILPVAALLIAWFFMNRSDKENKSKNDNASEKMRNTQTYEDEQYNA